MLQDFRVKVFLKLASEKSFTKAAEALGISQPAVSQNISELEKCLGLRLFQRLRGETLLTPAGEVFAGYARRILAAYADTELLFSPIDVMEVNIGVSDDLFKGLILSELKDFTVVHPEVSIIFTSADDSADINVSAVLSSDREGESGFRMVYKPTQAFAVTKTCEVLKNILGF